MAAHWNFDVHDYEHYNFEQFTDSNHTGTNILRRTGTYLTLGGLTTATFLNGADVQVLAKTATGFVATYSHANYSSAADTGTAKLIGAPGIIPYFANVTAYQPHDAAIGGQLMYNFSDTAGFGDRGVGLELTAGTGISNGGNSIWIAN